MPSDRLRILVAFLTLALFFTTVALSILDLPMKIVSASGYSMYPSFDNLAIYVMVSTDIRKPQVGDVVMYRSVDGFYVVHRVVAVYGDFIVAKGDNNPVDDGVIHISSVKYVAVAGFRSFEWMIPVALAFSTALRILLSDAPERLKKITETTAYTLLAVITIYISVFIYMRVL